MDCRNSLLLGLCLLGSASGCVTQPAVPGGSVSALMGVGPDGRPPVREAGPRKPSAELCVAYGNVRERTAAQLNAEPVRQQRWREEARKSYQRGIELEPNAKAGYVARMLERLNQPDKSKEHLRLALQAKPDLSAAQEMLARLEGPAGE